MGIIRKLFGLWTKKEHRNAMLAERQEKSREIILLRKQVEELIRALADKDKESQNIFLGFSKFGAILSFYSHQGQGLGLLNFEASFEPQLKDPSHSNVAWGYYRSQSAQSILRAIINEFGLPGGWALDSERREIRLYKFGLSLIPDTLRDITEVNNYLQGKLDEYVMMERKLRVLKGVDKT